MNRLRRLWRVRKLRSLDAVIDPDVVFLDAKNIPGFDKNQFEDRIERPLSFVSLVFAVVVCVVIILVFTWRATILQVAQGEQHFTRSERNRLDTSVVPAERGIITDRNGVPLAWNERDQSKPLLLRRYATNVYGLGAITGYVSYPSIDKNGNVTAYHVEAKDGIEKLTDEKLRGTHGIKLVETSVDGEVQSEGVLDKGIPGSTVESSIDARVQNAYYEAIQHTVDERGFLGGAGALMDISTGELIAYVSYPSYSPEDMTNGARADIVASLNDPRKKFFDRISSGSFAPGSIVKPFISLAALNEKIITPDKSILSTGQITIPNPYFPDKPSIFRDWKAHGWVNMRQAIAVSSDVYYYAIGGGFEDQKGLGIKRIDDYMMRFGFGVPLAHPFLRGNSGQIPTPEWKEKTFNGDPWRLGDTYHTSIGQFGFLVTPGQALRATAGIATKGTLVEPTVLKNDSSVRSSWKKIDFTAADWKVIHEGMRLTVEEGTALALNGLPFELGAKTGTAEVGAKKEYVHSWVIGFYPYEKPKYAFVTLIERGPRANTVGASYVTRQFFDKLLTVAPEYMAFGQNTPILTGENQATPIVDSADEHR